MRSKRPVDFGFARTHAAMCVGCRPIDRKPGWHGVLMRFFHGFPPTLVVLAALSLASLARAQTDTASADVARAAEAFDKGDRPGGLAIVENVLTQAPENQAALYLSAFINLNLGNADAARGRLERLLNLAGNYAAAWELMVQVTQSQGDLVRRDEAIARLKISISSAIDPNVRRKADFLCDRIQIGDRALYGVNYWQRGGSDFTRYQFALGDPRTDPKHGILLSTDTATTENWASTALLAQKDKQIFHLDIVDPSPNGDRTATYQWYVGEPKYDTVRADVMKILRGEVQPLSGGPGSLWGVLKK